MEREYAIDGVTRHDEIRDENARGSSLEEIAALVGLTEDDVREILMSYGELEPEA